MSFGGQANWRTILRGIMNMDSYFKLSTEGAKKYSTKEDLKKLRPMILKRIENRAGMYPIKAMIPVAREVLQARFFLIHAISTLLNVFPSVACKFCPEVYIGEEGHLIRTCCGYQHRSKNLLHSWTKCGVEDILVPVETFHLENMFQPEIRHHQRFDFERVSAVVELCWQGGADSRDKNLQPGSWILEMEEAASNDAKSLSTEDLRFVAKETLRTWEELIAGVKRLLLVYPAKVCKYCSEVHVGPSGHRARLCGLFKYQSWRGTHFWQKAGVDDLVPRKIVWQRRPQDPPLLLNEHRDFYGHAPAVVNLCSKADIVPPPRYFCMMKVGGLPGPSYSA